MERASLVLGCGTRRFNTEGSPMRKIMLVIDDYNELVSLEGFFRRLGFDVLSLGKDILAAGALLSFTPDLLLATAKGRQVDGAKLALRLKKSAPSAKIALMYPSSSKPALTSDVEMVVDALIELPWSARSLIDITAKLLGLDAQPLLDKHEKINASKMKASEQARFGGDGSNNGSDVVRVSGATGLAAAGIMNTSGSANPVGAANVGGGAHAGRGAGGANVDGASGQSNVARATHGSAATVSQMPSASSVPGASSAAVTWDPITTPGMASQARSQRSAAYDQFLKTHDDGPIDGVLPRAKSVEAMKKLKADSASEQAELESLLESKREFVRTIFREGAKKAKG
jgi:hypothetical protein